MLRAAIVVIAARFAFHQQAVFIVVILIGVALTSPCVLWVSYELFVIIVVGCGERRVGLIAQKPAALQTVDTAERETARGAPVQEREREGRRGSETARDSERGKEERTTAEVVKRGRETKGGIEW
jgi:hypothetical protein